MQDFLQVLLELFQGGDAVGSGLQSLFFMDKDLLAAALDQWPQALSHAPAYVAHDLEPVRTWDKEGDAAIPQDTNGFGKALKGLQIEAGEIELLELFSGVHRKNLPLIHTDKH